MIRLIKIRMVKAPRLKPKAAIYNADDTAGARWAGMGVLGVPWLYPTEINALEMRTKGKWSSRGERCFRTLQLCPLE